MRPSIGRSTRGRTAFEANLPSLGRDEDQDCWRNIAITPVIGLPGPIFLSQPSRAKLLLVQSLFTTVLFPELPVICPRNASHASTERGASDLKSRWVSAGELVG
jgi:hypothetical protein